MQLLICLKVLEAIDIWRAAALLIKQHGDDAELQAACHMDAMIQRADEQGVAVGRADFLAGLVGASFACRATIRVEEGLNDK